MGTDLYQIGNHRIFFNNKHIEETADQIKITLDKTKFPNPEFLKLAALRWANSIPKDTREIYEIKTKKDWNFDIIIEEDDATRESDYIEFYGPFSLNLTFYKNKITFWNPPYRYRSWYEMDDTTRDEWRKFMYHVVKLFGGDKVIYLADNGHKLEEFTYYESSFEEIEKELLNKLGEPKYTFQEVADDIDNSYYIDDFKTLNWSESVSLDEYLPEPDGACSTNFNLEVYSTKRILRKLDFFNEVLLHKKSNNNLNFYHLAVYEGLLCIHTGQVGISENIEVKIDKYAPYVFEQLKAEIQNQGYENQSKKWFSIKINDSISFKNWYNAILEFEREIMWQGIGHKTKAPFESTEYSEKSFFTIDETRALNLFLECGRKYNAKGKIKVVTLNDDGNSHTLFENL